MPRGLVLLLMGIALGAGGLLFLQTNYGQQRLTVQQSEQLYSELNAANNASTSRPNSKKPHSNAMLIK